jgi:hypothetical protein
MAVPSCMYSPCCAPLSSCAIVCWSNPACAAHWTCVRPRMVRMRRNLAPIASTSLADADIPFGIQSPSLLIIMGQYIIEAPHNARTT